MPAALRAWISFVAVTLVAAMCLGTWYWLYVGQNNEGPRSKAETLAPQLTEAVEAGDTNRLQLMLQRYSFALAVTDSDKKIQAANVSRRQAEKWLISGQLQGPIPIPEQTAYLYFQASSSWLTPALIWLLFFCLLAGALSAGFYYLLSLHILRQAETIDDLTSFQQTDSLEHRLVLEEKLKGVQLKSLQLKQDLKAAQGENIHLRQRVKELKEKIQALETQAQEARSQIQALKLAHETDQKNLHKIAQLEHQQQLLSRQKEDLEHLVQLKNINLKEMAVSRAGFQLRAEQLEKQLEEQTETLKATRKRIKELNWTAEKITQQDIELHQMGLRVQNLQDQQRQWEGERQKMLEMIDSLQKTSDETGKTLAKWKERGRQLAVALKKQTELVHHLPVDLQSAQAELEKVIQAKDGFEHENADLRGELADKTSEINRLKQHVRERVILFQETYQRLADAEQQALQQGEELRRLSDVLADKLMDIERLQQNYEQSNHALKDTLLERDQLKAALLENQDALARERQERFRLRADYEAMQEKLDQIEHEQYAFKLQQQQRVINMLTAEKEKLQLSVTETDQKFRRLGQVYQAVRKEREKAEAENQELKRHLESSRSMIHLMQQKLEGESVSGELA